MPYATVAQVQSEFKNLSISATTPITTTEVARFIDEADVEIDSILSAKYVTPLTGSNSLIVARMVSIMLVAHRIKNILRVKNGTDESDQEGRGGDLRKRAYDILDRIITDKMKLTDATVALSGEGVKSYVSANDVSHIFERDTEQW